MIFEEFFFSQVIFRILPALVEKAGLKYFSLFELFIFWLIFIKLSKKNFLVPKMNQILLVVETLFKNLKNSASSRDKYFSVNILWIFGFEVIFWNWRFGWSNQWFGSQILMRVLDFVSTFSGLFNGISKAFLGPNCNLNFLFAFLHSFKIFNKEKLWGAIKMKNDIFKKKLKSFLKWKLIPWKNEIFF